MPRGSLVGLAHLGGGEQVAAAAQAADQVGVEGRTERGRASS